MIRTRSVRPRRILVATAVAGLTLGTGLALADDINQVVVEAKAPVHSQKTREGEPGGARVDLLSITYHVHLAGLDLTKSADVATAQDQVKVAAKKACAAIQSAYAVEHLSDAQACEREATARGMDQLNKMVTAAAKPK